MKPENVQTAHCRAVRTFVEPALACISTGAVVLGDVNWLAAVTAVLLALSGLPEAK